MIFNHISYGNLDPYPKNPKVDVISYIFDIKLSEILYITNIFRLSMFLVYSIFGFINLYWSSKKIILDK